MQRRLEKSDSTADTNIEVAAVATSSAVAAGVEMSTNLQDAPRNTPIAEQDQEIAIGTVCLTVTYAVGDNGDAEMGDGFGGGVGGRRRALVPSSSGSDDTSTIGINNQQQQQQELLLNEQQPSPQQQEQEQPQNEQLEGQQQQDNNCDQAAGSCIDI